MYITIAFDLLIAFLSHINHPVELMIKRADHRESCFFISDTQSSSITETMMYDTNKGQCLVLEGHLWNDCLQEFLEDRSKYPEFLDMYPSYRIL